MRSSRPKTVLPCKDIGWFVVFSISNLVQLDAPLEICSNINESSKPGGKVSLSSGSKRTGVFVSIV